MVPELNVQGRTGTKFSTGHKPPRGAPKVKNEYFPTDIFERSKAKRSSEAREKTAGVWGRCGPLNGEILRFQGSRSPKIDNSMRKSSCSVSSR